jgi:hypothetical protein
MRLMSRAALALAAIFTLAPALHAQTSFSVAAGAALPMGDFADIAKMGYNVTAALGIKPPLAPVGARIDGMFNSFDSDPSGVTFRILAGTVNATLSGATMLPLGYLIGGLGMYRMSSDVTGSEAETDLGFNVGAGLKFPLTGFSTFAEIRFHMINTEGGSTNLVPIVFGLTF